MFRSIPILPHTGDFYQVFASPILARAICNHHPRDDHEVYLFRGERLSLTERRGEWWYIGKNSIGAEGWIPAEFVQLLGDAEFKNAMLFKEWRERVKIALSGGVGQVPQSSANEEEDSKTKSSRKEMQKEGEGGVSLLPASKPITQPASDDKLGLITRDTFPFLPTEACRCTRPICVSRKTDTGLGACVHDVEKLLRDGVDDDYTGRWLNKEKRRWHPDRVMRRVARKPQGWRNEAKMLIEEMFVILGELVEQETSKRL